MLTEWALTIVALTFMRKGDIMNCSCYRAVKHLEHDMKVVESVLGKEGFNEWKEVYPSA